MIADRQVSGVLGGSPLSLALRSRAIRIASVSTPKQTETTQRWKVGLSAEGHAIPLHTKIEFSRRPRWRRPRSRPDHLDTYGSREAWDTLQLRVVDLLEQARHERP